MNCQIKRSTKKQERETSAGDKFPLQQIINPNEERTAYLTYAHDKLEVKNITERDATSLKKKPRNLATN